MRAALLLLIAASSCGAQAVRPDLPAARPDFAPPPMYEALFADGASYTYHVIIVGEEDDTGETMRCYVSSVRRTPAAVAARLICAGVGYEGETDELEVPAEVSPAGVYVATANGLFRTDDLPSDDDLGQLTSRKLVMLPQGEERTILDTENAALAIYRSESEPSWWCRHESFGPGWPDDGQSAALCFRPGVGLVGGGYTMSRGGSLFRGHYQLAEMTPGTAELPDGAPPAQALVINEVSASADPSQTSPSGALPDDWFEVVNVSTETIQLDDFVYSDRPGDFARVVAFPTLTLAPGARYVQHVSDEQSSFRLNSNEALAIYRSADHARSDEVSWAEGESPAGGSYARVPDITGSFTTLAAATPGRANH